MKSKSIRHGHLSHTDPKTGKPFPLKSTWTVNTGKINLTFYVYKITEEQMSDEQKRAWNNVVAYLEEAVIAEGST